MTKAMHVIKCRICKGAMRVRGVATEVGTVVVCDHCDAHCPVGVVGGCRLCNA